MMNAPHAPERRRFLIRGTYGLVALALSAFGLMVADAWRSAGRFSSERWTDVASLDAFRVDGIYPLPSARVAVVREGDRLAALSLECTHLGCMLSATDQGFFCPCHGSEFGPRGELYSGPAAVPLPWHDLRIEAGRVWIHSGGKKAEPLWVAT
jgi:cytochrome b6-f complex iron-sulfur subunit